MQQYTLEELEYDVHYGYCFNLKCELLYRHLDVLLNIVQLIGGSGALLALVGNNQTTLKIVGAALAVAAAISLLVSPAAKAAAHATVKDKFTLLLGKYRTMDPSALAALIADHRVGAPAGITLLANPACNGALLAMNRRDAVEPLTTWEKLFDAVA